MLQIIYTLFYLYFFGGFLRLRSADGYIFRLCISSIPWPSLRTVVPYERSRVASVGLLLQLREKEFDFYPQSFIPERDGRIGLLWEADDVGPEDRYEKAADAMTEGLGKEDNGGRSGAYSIAAAFAGTLIGAGFASGQELMQFFVVFGARGLWGVSLAALLSSGLGALIMFGARSRVPTGAADRVLARTLDGFMALFFFGLLAVMLAGCDSLARSALGAPPLAGGLVMAALTAGAVAGGMRNALRVFRAVVPVMAAVAAAAGLAVLLALPEETVLAVWAREGRWTGNWVTRRLFSCPTTCWPPRRCWNRWAGPPGTAGASSRARRWAAWARAAWRSSCAPPWPVVTPASPIIRCPC
jgi:hypothetical protein